MLLTTPETIRTLQRKLYTKAKQEPAYRFYALYDKVWRANILMFAYRLVRANKGRPGVDGINFADIAQKMGIDKSLSELSSGNGWLENGACLGVKNIGKPCAGKLHARFDEGGQARACPLLYLSFVTLSFVRACPPDRQVTEPRA